MIIIGNPSLSSPRKFSNRTITVLFCFSDLYPPGIIYVVPKGFPFGALLYIIIQFLAFPVYAVLILTSPDSDEFHGGMVYP